jgi:hypothetical protein
VVLLPSVTVAFLLLVALAVVWATRHRTTGVEDVRLARVADADAEGTRSAGYFCSHLPIDNPRVSGSRSGF